MSKSKHKKTLLIIFTVLLLAGLVILIFFLTKKPAANQEATKEAEIEMVKNVVAEFGSKLKMVPLLASKDTLKQAMDNNYANYLAPELLQTWENNPSMALGRLASSPWPEEINITSVKTNTDGSYAVSGSVKEMTSEQMVKDGEAPGYPVALELRKLDGSWLITGIEKNPSVPVSSPPLPPKPATSSAPIDLARPVTISGTHLCLPHRDTTGPQTMECALGLQADDGTYYSLDTQGKTELIFGLATGSRITVTGMFVPIEVISSNLGRIYPVKGIIRVIGITKT